MIKFFKDKSRDLQEESNRIEMLSWFYAGIAEDITEAGITFDVLEYASLEHWELAGEIHDNYIATGAPVKIYY
jgi:hypothetical protein